MSLSLSWSELCRWEEDPKEWERQYVLGLKDPPSEFNKMLGEGWEHEQYLEASLGGIPIKGYLDGKRPPQLLEVKSGARLWDKVRAETHGQLHFYDLLLNLNGIPIEENLLFSCSTVNGKCVLYRSKAHMEDAVEIQKRIKRAYEWMCRQGLWDCRLSSKQQTVV